MLKKVIEIQAAKFENSNLEVSCFKKITYKGGDCCHLQLCEKVTHIFRHVGLLIP